MNYETVLGDLALSDDRFVVLTAENRAPIRNLPPLLGKRFIDTGIAEQALIGMSAGLALRGRIPVAHALAAFLTLRPFEFIRTDVGVANLPVKLVGYAPGILSEANGPTHQALEDVALMRGIPHMNVFCPADVEDLVLGLRAVLEHPAPWYIRYVDRPAPIQHNRVFEIGRAEVVKQGGDVGILAYGALFREAHEAAGRIEDMGYSVKLVNLRTLKPVDEAEIVATARATRLVVTVEDHFVTGGLFSIVSEILVRQRVRAHVYPISFGERWFTPGRLGQVLGTEELVGAQLAARILGVLEDAHGH
ncbi:MAG TPA: transketolase C-terminal domain-containing protein [Gemmatimonadales bacterium]|jgi:transketolase|nr:transketolase C-terminal domain-containing protein [Gemmatimonadales bacterium]